MHRTTLYPTRRGVTFWLMGAMSAVVVPWPATAQALDAARLLALSDSIRNPGQSFKVTVTVAEFERGSLVASSVLVSYSRTLESNRGQFASILRYTEPSRDAGKIILKNGADLWFFDPNSKATVRISPQQRLLGNASNGDVVTVNFARDYKARLIAEEAITDGERAQRRSHKLALAADSDDATYSEIELWIDVETHAPIKARFLSDSGRLLKTAYYRKFQNQLGADRPTETVIIDGINSHAVTIVRFSNYSARSIPASWFQRDFLPRFQGE